MQPLELDEGGVTGGTAGLRHGPSSLRWRPAVNRFGDRVTMTAMRPVCAIALLLSIGIAGAGPAAAQGRRPPAAAAPRVYTATLPVEKMRNKQAVVTTSLGDLVIELLPDAAPDHVGYVMKLADERAYDGTTFHRAILRGLIQGGDPLSKDPAKKAQYGTGGLGVLKFRANDLKHVRGAVSAVLRPGQPDSAGRPVLRVRVGSADPRRAVHGVRARGRGPRHRAADLGDAGRRHRSHHRSRRDHVGPHPRHAAARADAVRDRDGRAARRLSGGAGDDDGRGHPGVLSRPRPRPRPQLPAPGQARVYDGTAFHRVVPGFVVQTGALTSRKAPLSQKQRPFVVNLPPEFNPTLHEAGILSMARGDDPASAQTSFFVCLGRAPSLDNKYTVFGRVLDGMPVIEALAKVPLNGEEPVTRVEIVRVRILPPAP